MTGKYFKINLRYFKDLICNLPVILYLKIFLLALLLRLLCYGIIQYYEIPTLLTLEQTEKYLFSNNPPKELQLADASDYYYTSIDLEVPKFLQEKWGYTHWYERNPLHTIVLHLTHRSILFQIILSCLTCAILFKINNIVLIHSSNFAF